MSSGIEQLQPPATVGYAHPFGLLPIVLYHGVVNLELHAATILSQPDIDEA